jgi:hypothetical protein
MRCARLPVLYPGLAGKAPTLRVFLAAPSPTCGRRIVEVVMAKRTVADQFVEILLEAGVRRMYGVVGDSLNPVVDAIRRHDGNRLGACAARGGGRVRRRRRGPADRSAGGRRRQLRPRQPAPDQRPV